MPRDGRVVLTKRLQRRTAHGPARLPSRQALAPARTAARMQGHGSRLWSSPRRSMPRARWQSMAGPARLAPGQGKDSRLRSCNRSTRFDGHRLDRFALDNLPQRLRRHRLLDRRELGPRAPLFPQDVEHGLFVRRPVLYHQGVAAAAHRERSASRCLYWNRSLAETAHDNRLLTRRNGAKYLRRNNSRPEPAHALQTGCSGSKLINDPGRSNLNRNARPGSFPGPKTTRLE